MILVKGLIAFFICAIWVCIVALIIIDIKSQVKQEREEKNDAMLKGMTVGELLDGELFKKELQVQIDNEIASHDRMAREAFSKGLRLQRSPHQRLRDREVFNVDDLTAAYKRIVCKQLSEFSAAEREYIKQVVMMAYWRVVQQLKKPT